MNPESVVAHIRANADAVANLSINSELTGAAVNEFCTWVEAQLKPQSLGFEAGGHAAVHASPQNPEQPQNPEGTGHTGHGPSAPPVPPQTEVKKEKAVGSHNLHRPGR